MECGFFHPARRKIHTVFLKNVENPVENRVNIHLRMYKIPSKQEKKNEFLTFQQEK